MSGFRRHLMAEVANRSFIEGYCNVYNSTFTFYLNFTNSQGNYTQINVTTDANGYWRYTLPNGKVVKFMVNAFSRHSQVESDKLISISFSKKFVDNVVSWYNTFGNGTGSTYACRNIRSIEGMAGDIVELGFTFPFMGCENLEYIDISKINLANATSLSSVFRNCFKLRKIIGIDTIDTENVKVFNAMFYGCFSLESDTDNPFDLSGWNVASLTKIDNLFRSTSSEQSDWYDDNGWFPYSKLKDVRLFDIPDGCTITNSFSGFFGGQDNFDIDSIGIVGGTLDFTSASLNLQSAKNILSALTYLQGGSATLSFSTSTKNLISADSAALVLVAQAQTYGWTITGF